MKLFINDVEKKSYKIEDHIKIDETTCLFCKEKTEKNDLRTNCYERFYDKNGNFHIYKYHRDCFFKKIKRS